MTGEPSLAGPSSSWRQGPDCGDGIAPGEGPKGLPVSSETDAGAGHVPAGSGCAGTRGRDMPNEAEQQQHLQGGAGPGVPHEGPERPPQDIHVSAGPQQGAPCGSRGTLRLLSPIKVEDECVPPACRGMERQDILKTSAFGVGQPDDPHKRNSCGGTGLPRGACKKSEVFLPPNLASPEGCPGDWVAACKIKEQDGALEGGPIVSPYGEGPAVPLGTRVSRKSSGKKRGHKADSPDVAVEPPKKKSFLEEVGPAAQNCRVGIWWEEDSMFYKVSPSPCCCCKSPCTA